jgi:hypothetical protein
MENSFPTRSNFLIIILLLLLVTSCTSKKDYEINPVPVYTEIVKIDSFYTITEYIKTGKSDSLFCGIKGIFDSYALLLFDTIPEDFDSIFIRLKSDSVNTKLYFYELIDEWYEDSLYTWEDISWLINTSQLIDSSLVETINPLIKLNEQTINVIDENGIAIYSDSFYSFASRQENEPKLKIYIGDSTYSLSCLKDLYITENPFESFLKDTLLVGRGIDIKSNIFIPVDSLPTNRENIARAGLIFKIEEPLPFVITAYDSGGNDYSERNVVEGDTNYIEFNLRTLIQDDFLDNYIKVTIEANRKLEGIEVKSLKKPEFKLMWAEIGMK